MKQARQSPTPLRSPPRRRMAGLSLIELMISITIGLMILSGVAFVFVNSSAARNELERASRQIENGRFAIDILSDDLRLAGFFGELEVGTPALPVVPLPAALPDICSTVVANWASAIPVHLQGYDNGAGAPACIPASLNVKPNTDILVVRRARTCYAGAADCEATIGSKPYVQVSLCATETTASNVDVGSAGTFVLTKKDCVSTAEKRQYLLHVYYISTDNGAGQNVPTLKRLEFDGAGFEVVPLVEGIEEFNIEYGLDTSGDGAPDAYTTAPSSFGGCAAPACQVTNWMNVVTAQINLLARNLETSSDYTDTKTYNLGNNAAGAAITVAPGDGYRRHIYTGLVRINNPAGRRDTP